MKKCRVQSAERRTNSEFGDFSEGHNKFTFVSFVSFSFSARKTYRVAKQHIENAAAFISNFPKGKYIVPFTAF